jgi:pimeloyl-ACP methyl ester carboxylesterase
MRWVAILLLGFVAATRMTPVTDAKDAASWEKQRAELRKQWDEILGPMPAPVPLNVQIVSTEELADHTRLLIRYQNDAKTTNDAYLLIPKTPGRHPAAVCLHPTSKTTLRDPVGLSNRESVHHALHLVRRGYVCIAPANFLWAKPKLSYQQAADALLAEKIYKTGMAKMLFAAMRAVDVLLDRDDVDPKRIAAIGHSLGGKEALYLAAFDERIAAAVSCEGGVGLSMSNWDADWYLGAQIKSADFHHDNNEVLAMIAPRAILVIGGEKSDGAATIPYIENAKPVWRLYDAEGRIDLMRHTYGHNFPPPGDERERVYRWLDEQLSKP